MVLSQTGGGDDGVLPSGETQWVTLKKGKNSNVASSASEEAGCFSEAVVERFRRHVRANAFFEEVVLVFVIHQNISSGD